MDYLENTIRNCLKKVGFDESMLSREDSLFDLGMDSLILVLFASELERSLKLRISPKSINAQHFNSIESVENLLKGLK